MPIVVTEGAAQFESGATDRDDDRPARGAVVLGRLRRRRRRAVEDA
ncbi:MAG: hypothetical protein ABEL97_12620 [Salinibacter sp.]